MSLGWFFHLLHEKQWGGRFFFLFITWKTYFDLQTKVKKYPNYHQVCSSHKLHVKFSQVFSSFLLQSSFWLSVFTVLNDRRKDAIFCVCPRLIECIKLHTFFLFSRNWRLKEAQVQFLFTWHSNNFWEKERERPNEE